VTHAFHTIHRGRTIALAVLLALTVLLMAECDKDDSGPGSYKPTGGDTVWHPKRKAFTTAPVPQRILILGDSIMASTELPVPADHFDRRLATALSIAPARLTNGAVSGLTLIGAHPNLVDRAPALLGALNPGDVVIIGIGMNDACTGSPVPAFESAYLALVAQATALGLHVLVGLVTPVMPALWPCEVARQQIDAWLSATYPGDTIDFPAVLGAPGVTWILPRKAMEDGEHPDEGGTAEMADLTGAAVRAHTWWPATRVLG
jgi:GDSL-like Lipase/Acylhydrolase family